MKKSQLTLAIPIMMMLIAFCFNSCRKTERSEPIPVNLILKAKAWFEAQNEIGYLPNWEEAQVIQVNNLSFVILPSNILISGKHVAKSYLAITLPKDEGTVKGNIIELFNAESTNIESLKNEIISNYLINKDKAEFNSSLSFNILLFDTKHDFLNGNPIVKGKIEGSISLDIPKAIKIEKLMCDRCRTMKERTCSNYYYILRYAGGPIISETYLYSVCDGGGEGGSGGGGGSSAASPTDIKNQMKDACLKEMVKAAIDKGIQFTTEQTLNSIFDVSSKVNLTFIQAAYADDETDGGTLPPTGVTFKSDGSINTFNITIRLNEKTMPKASKEYISATIIHETLHAYFDYVSGGIHDPDKQHIKMSTDKYLLWFEKAIKGMYPAMSDADATALAWGGLEGTEAYDAYKLKEPYAVGQMWLANSEYHDGSKGTKCGS